MVPRILIVEDDIDLRETYADVLEISGYTVDCVSSCADAIKSLLKTKPNLVILDMQLNGESGSIVLSFIRRYSRLVATKVIIVSGHADMATRACRDWGADVFLSKPVPLGHLVSNIASLLTATSEK